MPVSRRERLDEIFRRLAATPAPISGEAALELICQVLEEVEDQLSGIPKAEPPPLPGTDDGRMYPPRSDKVLREPNGRLIATTRRHLVICEADGGIEIINSFSGLSEFKR